MVELQRILEELDPKDEVHRYRFRRAGLHEKAIYSYACICCK